MTGPQHKSFRTRSRTQTQREQRIREIHIVPPDVVRAAIARAIRGQTASSRLGSLTLLPHQQDAVSRLRTTLRELRIALLADDVGLGKTYVALAVARDYARVCIIAPATLLPMWRTAAARAQVANVVLRSVQSYSRQPAIAPSPASSATTGRTLFIIDEAHHLRTPTTRRFRAVATAVSGHDVLLLSATPIHNSPHDLKAILGLSLGARANHLSHALLARVIVRRSVNMALPTVLEHEATRVPHDPATLNAILALPAPLPAHDGAVAGALIRMGLLRAWCSSDAALIHTLRQRLLRGEALRQALLSGRHPTASELRSWLVGDHDVQLAFPELMAQHAPATGPLLDVLDTHLSAVHALLTDHRRSANADQVRAETMKALMAAHPNTPIIAFSQFAETVRAIGRALSDIAGIGVLTGQRASIASGTITRAEALEHFAPVAQGRPPPPPHQRIWLLLTTDLLAEGVNLQDAAVLVHLDLPWTEARKQQRIGRCVRIGSPHHTVHVHAIAPHASAEAVLRIHDRLHHKARLARRMVGASHRAVRGEVPHEQRNGKPSAEEYQTPTPLSAADKTSAVHRITASWANHQALLPDQDHHTVLAAISAPVAGFIAVVSLIPMGTSNEVDVTRRLVVHGRMVQSDARTPPRWKVGTSMHQLLLLLELVDKNETPHSIPANALKQTTRRLRQWARHHAMYATFGVPTDANTMSAENARSAIHTRVSTAIHAGLSKLPAATRSPLRRLVHAASKAIDVAHGAGAETALAEWLSVRHTMPFTEWLTHWQTYTALSHANAHSTANAHNEATLHSDTANNARVTPKLCIHNLLILCPP